MACRYDTELEQLNSYKTALDRVTRVACYVISALDPETRNEILSQDEEARLWWEAHQAMDARRKAAELTAKRKQDAKDLEEYKRLKEKFGDLDA